MKLDFHSPANTPLFGYGRAYFAIRNELERQLCNSDSLTEPYIGGDVQIYCGGLYNELNKYFQRKSNLCLAYTMFESTVLPASFKLNMNIFDGLIVPSDWCRDVFIANGYEKPIFVAPLGINPDDWPLLERPCDRLPFRMLWQGAVIQDRKGGRLALKVFNELNLPDSEFIMKFNPKYTEAHVEWDFYLDEECIADILKYPYGVEKINDIRVRSCGRAFNQSDMLKFLSYVDLSLYPSMGEGFGLIPLEHMASGLPVILADNSGMAMYSDPRYCWPIACQEKCSSFGAHLGIDYLADEEEIKRAVLWAYNNRAQANLMGSDASEWVHQEWTYEKTARRIIEISREFLNERVAV